MTDSRQVQSGDVFWGLPGTRFDGAQFAAEAYGRGASGCLLYTSDAADDLLCVDLGGRRILKQKKPNKLTSTMYHDIT